MQSILLIINGLVALILVFSIEKTIHYYRIAKLKEYVKWAGCGDCDPVLNRYSYTSALEFAIADAGRNVPVEYRINFSDPEERHYVLEIVKDYQQNIMRQFFLDHSIVPKSKHVLEKEDFFLFTLYQYLSKHQCDKNFTKFNIRNEKPSMRNQNSDERPWGNSEYPLSEFGFIYHKLLYTAYMSCKACAALTMQKWPEELLTEILSTKRIDLSRF